MFGDQFEVLHTKRAVLGFSRNLNKAISLLIANGIIFRIYSPTIKAGI